MPAEPVQAYLPKNGENSAGSVGCGKSSQLSPWAVVMKSCQIGAGKVPPATALMRPASRDRASGKPTQTAVDSCGV